jgi:prepilin-type N-terminal cleavage/methylation domain-containing protein
MTRTRRGFTLLELGIALTVMGILSGLGAIALKGRLDAARVARAADDLREIVEGARAAISRGSANRVGEPLVPSLTLTGSTFRLRFYGYAVMPTCFDLSLPPSDTLSAAPLKAPPTPLATMLTDRARSGNAFGRKFVVCVDHASVRAETCVPSEVGSPSWVGECTLAVAGCTNAERCLSTSAPAYPDHGAGRALAKRLEETGF